MSKPKFTLEEALCGGCLGMSAGATAGGWLCLGIGFLATTSVSAIGLAILGTVIGGIGGFCFMVILIAKAS